MPTRRGWLWTQSLICTRVVDLEEATFSPEEVRGW
jgi:hypothetical protein